MHHEKRNTKKTWYTEYKDKLYKNTLFQDIRIHANISEMSHLRRRHTLFQLKQKKTSYEGHNLNRLWNTTNHQDRELDWLVYSELQLIVKKTLTLPCHTGHFCGSRAQQVASSLRRVKTIIKISYWRLQRLDVIHKLFCRYELRSEFC